MSKPLLLCLLGLFLLAGCKKETVPTTASTTTENIGTVEVNNFDFNYLSSKAQLTLKDNDDNLSSTVSIRMKKDSVIWVSVQPGLGIEAARVMLTQDSVYIVNRLQKKYVAADYAFLRNKLQVDVSFELLQAILLGNYQAQGAEKALNEGDMQHVQQLRQNLTFDYYIGRLNNKLQQLNVQDNNTGNTITVKYGSFEDVGQVPFAHDLAAQVLQKGQVSDFTISHSRISVSDEVLFFPFSIPAGYERLALN